MLQTIMASEKKGQIGTLPYTNYLIRQVIDELIKDIAVDSKRESKQRPAAYKKFALYLGSLDPKIAALRAIQGVLEVLFAAGAADIPQPVGKLAAFAAGKAVYREYLMRHLQQLNAPMFNSLLREYDKSMTRDEAHMVSAFKAKFEKEGYEYPVWEFGDIESVGTYLLSRMVAHGFIESYNRTERKKGRAMVVQYVALTAELRSASLHITDLAAAAPRVAGPLIEPPKDWDYTTNSGGGYHTEEMHRLLPYAVQGNGLKAVAESTVKALNILQQRKWEIASDVLAVVVEVSKRRDFGDIVSPDAGPKPEWRDEFTPEEKTQWKGLARAWYTDKKVRAVKHMQAQRVFQEARDLSRYPAIWFAYYADFRTRKYARSFGVSPQGNDLEKGLLRLSNGRSITTPEALRWFKIHGANKYGLDKETLQDREAWVDNNEELILGIGHNPLYNLGWTTADTPVQFLAWCMEYVLWKASPDGFLSRIPLGQDGTCNGLQNFSALMRDPVGGAAVNLTPSDKPRDIYADVAVRVLEILKAMPQDTIRDAWIAHGVNRKVTKRTTMTLPYGCTRYACSQFVAKDYLEVVKPIEFEAADYGDAANYLSHVIWKALDDVVVKAREVMEWLKGWSKHTAKLGMPVMWITPNGMRVASEYKRMSSVRIRSAAFKTQFRLYKGDHDTPDLVKIANAVAPNFVHSLDASHMDRVILQANAEGMEVVTIHDDFGVHAKDTQRFHEIIREQFIVMYTETDMLGQMAAYSGYSVPPPSLGSLDLGEILNSKYFFA